MKKKKTRAMLKNMVAYEVALAGLMYAGAASHGERSEGW